VGRRSIDTEREEQKEQKALSCLCEIKEQQVTLLHFPFLGFPKISLFSASGLNAYA